MNASHSHPEFVPAHRVVNRNGLLTGRHYEYRDGVRTVHDACAPHLDEYTELRGTLIEGIIE